MSQAPGKGPGSQAPRGWALTIASSTSNAVVYPPSDVPPTIQLSLPLPSQCAACPLASGSPVQSAYGHVRCVWTHLALAVLNHSGFAFKMYVPKPE